MLRKMETRPIQLAVAQDEDAGTLTIIQSRAFLDDFRWIAAEQLEQLLALDDPPQGPPGVSSIEWTRKMIASPESIYYKILLGDRVVGGVIVAVDPLKYPEENFWRIFVEPVYQGRGIGQQAFRSLYALHPTVKSWRLGTPEYAARNRRFYEKMGFTLLEIRDLDGVWFRGCEYENALPQEDRAKL